ncbi:hypothetical protein DN069_19390 [Streptacidiphilus pinicola]|uniref:Uncharacterized protein n=1 Tax=Streptacidiphilus pinicola TaxID=2219663 RepID=A0A2X0J138_9ACTN|nr:hypothetical protein [Streptacidiphilus pinicola]RAG83926.1 hypothetical protein DN069_19390 [Streptacidiphilus pinicola]
MDRIHMALTGNVGAVHAVAAAVAGTYPTTERQVPRAPGMLHTRIYDVDATSPRPDQAPPDRAPVGAGAVQVKLSGDVDGVRLLATWMAQVFRSDELKASHEGARVSFEVHPDQAPPDAAPGG